MEQFVFVKLHAREGEEKAVEEALREVMVPSRDEPGCLDVQTRPAAVLHPFAMGRRSGVPEARGIAAHQAVF